MLNYTCRSLGTAYIKEVSQKCDGVVYYEILRGTEVLVRINSSADFTLIDTPEGKYKVECERRLLKKMNHSLYNRENGRAIATVEFPSSGFIWQSFLCSVRFHDQATYSFTRQSAQRQLFRPHTWRNFRYLLSNSDHDIHFAGNRKGGRIDYNREPSLLVTAAGLFIIDEIQRQSTVAS